MWDGGGEGGCVGGREGVWYGEGWYMVWRGRGSEGGVEGDVEGGRGWDMTLKMGGGMEKMEGEVGRRWEGKWGEDGKEERIGVWYMEGRDKRYSSWRTDQTEQFIHGTYNDVKSTDWNHVIAWSLMIQTSGNFSDKLF